MTKLTIDEFVDKFIPLMQWYGVSNIAENKFAISTFYHYIGDRLSREEFELAITLAFCECKFKPTPEEFVNLVKASKQEVRDRTCDKIRRVLAANPSNQTVFLLDLKKRAETGDEVAVDTISALNSVGGLDNLKKASTVSALDRLMDRFSRSLERCQRDRDVRRMKEMKDKSKSLSGHTVKFIED